jgi:hypothetical protein
MSGKRPLKEKETLNRLPFIRVSGRSHQDPVNSQGEEKLEFRPSGRSRGTITPRPLDPSAGVAPARSVGRSKPKKINQPQLRKTRPGS